MNPPTTPPPPPPHTHTHQQYYRTRHPHLNHTTNAIKGFRHEMTLAEEPRTVATIHRLLVPWKDEPCGLPHKVSPAVTPQENEV